MHKKRFSIGFSAVLAVAVGLVVMGTDASAQQETLLHSFGNGADGTYPAAGLIFDSAGNLYGTTIGGGAGGSGTVFLLAPGTGGTWTETVLRNFAFDNYGAGPASSLIFDATGNLYGTTAGVEAVTGSSSN